MNLSPNTLMLAAVIVAAAIWLVLRARRNAAQSALAHKAVEAGARLIDVRSPGEFAAGHLPGAVNIPVQELGRRMKDVGTKSRPVVVYCRSGARSGMATQMLVSSGFKEVVNLGPMSAW